MPLPRIAIDRSSPVPLYFQVSRCLEEAVDRGDLLPGERLPNEIEFAQSLAISRPTMRRALDDLVEKGMLTRKQGVGTRVASAQVRRRVALTSLYEDLSAAGRAPPTKVLRPDTRSSSPSTSTVPTCTPSRSPSTTVEEQGMPLVDRPDNRSLEYLVAGPPDGTPLVFHHGTPGAAVTLPALVDAASVRGLRLVTYARPGTAARPPTPAAVLAALGAGTFVTLGWSGGGPHALACAALLPDRCLAAASVSGVAPYDAEGPDWSAGMAAENLAEFAAAAAGETELTRFLTAEAGDLATIQAPELVSGLGTLVSE